MQKCPSSIRCWDSNPWPSKHEYPPITTRPGLVPTTLTVPHYSVSHSLAFWHGGLLPIPFIWFPPPSTPLHLFLCNGLKMSFDPFILLIHFCFFHFFYQNLIRSFRLLFWLQVAFMSFQKPSSAWKNVYTKHKFFGFPGITQKTRCLASLLGYP